MLDSRCELLPASILHADMRRPIAALLCCLRAMPACAKCPQPPFAGLGEMRQAYDCMTAFILTEACPERCSHRHRTNASKWPCCVWAARQRPSHELGAIQCEITRWLVEGLARDARANTSDIRLLASTARPYCHRAPPKLESALSVLRAHEHRSAKVCDRLVRLGTKFDGSKVACNSSGDVLPQTNCRVVSVGSNGDPAFESAVHAAAPWCIIETWDGTLVGARAKLAQRIPAFVNFVPRNWNAATIAEAAAAQRVASMLKIDCEGCEAALVPLWVDRVCTEQIYMEVHVLPTSLPEVTSMLAGLSADYSWYHLEMNPFGFPGVFFEVSMMRRVRCLT